MIDPANKINGDEPAVSLTGTRGRKTEDNYGVSRIIILL